VKCGDPVTCGDLVTCGAAYLGVAPVPAVDRRVLHGCYMRGLSESSVSWSSRGHGGGPREGSGRRGCGDHRERQGADQLGSGTTCSAVVATGRPGSPVGGRARRSRVAGGFVEVGGERNRRSCDYPVNHLGVPDGGAFMASGSGRPFKED